LDDLAIGDDLLLDLVDVAHEVLRSHAHVVDVLVDLLELVADLVEDREAVVVEVVEHLVQQPPGAAVEECLAHLVALVCAAEEQRHRAKLDRRQRDEVVRSEEDVELAGVEPADRLVVDGEVENREQVALALFLGVDVDLRPLTAREDVLDVEGVPAEAPGELVRLLVARSLEVDPGQVGAVELSEPRPLCDLGHAGGANATRTDARQARHRYSEGRWSYSPPQADLTPRLPAAEPVLSCSTGTAGRIGS